MNSLTDILKNRNYMFLAVLFVTAALIVISYQQSIVQYTVFVQDRSLYSESIKAANQGQYQAALDLLMQTSEPFQSDWNAYYVKGFFYMQLGDYETADACLQQAEDMAPVVLTKTEFLNLRGSLYILTGQKELALDYLNHSATLASTDEERQGIQASIEQANLLP